MEGETKGYAQKGRAGPEEGSDGALVGQSRAAEHGHEVSQGKEGVGVRRDEGRPRHDVRGRDLSEDAMGVRRKIGP